MKNNIKSLADELRKKIAEPNISLSNKDPVKGNTEGFPSKEKSTLKGRGTNAIAVLDLIKNFDSTKSNQMLHPRFDAKTIQLLGRLKLASGIDMNKVISFSVHYFFEQHPELKTFIKNSLENFEI